MRKEPGVNAYFGRRPGMDVYDLFVYRYQGGVGETLIQPSPGSYEWVAASQEEGVNRPLLSLPGPLVGNVVEAIKECWRETQPDPGTEARVLREVLGVEQRRVDMLLDRLAK